MPPKKQIIVTEQVLDSVVPDDEPESDVEVVKPKRVMSEKQKETLALGREKAHITIRARAGAAAEAKALAKQEKDAVKLELAVLKQAKLDAAANKRAAQIAKLKASLPQDESEIESEEDEPPPPPKKKRVPPPPPPSPEPVRRQPVQQQQQPVVKRPAMFMFSSNL